MKYSSKYNYILFIVTIVVISLAIISVFFKKNDEKIREGSYTQGFFVYDKLLGYKPKPNTKVSSILKVKDNIIYDVSYSIDQYSRRITPVDDRLTRDKFILFFGCSFVFGEGLQDDETIPFFTGKYAAGHMPYNYGFCGYGPQEMLARLQNGKIKDEIDETQGCLVYIFKDGHIRRAIGSMQCVTAWGKDMPYYSLTSDGRLVRQGSFASGRPDVYKSYLRLRQNRFLKFLRCDFPLYISGKDIELTRKIIEESYKVFKKNYKNGVFYVIFYPGSRYVGSMIPRLETLGIKCLDYSRLFDKSKKEYFISEYDSHPSKKTCEAIAQKLVQDMHSLEYAKDK